MGAIQKNLLIIDDDKLFCDAIGKLFHQASFRVSCAHTGTQGTAWCKRHRADVVLLDQHLPDGVGTGLCRTILESNEHAKIIFITAFPSFEHAVEAIRNGAYDYISKPMELEELQMAVERAFRTVQLEQLEEVQSFRHQQESRKNVLLGLDGGLAGIRELVEKAASSRAPVLITGETGTGKTVVAKAVHYLGAGVPRPFIETNCAALSEHLVESELFGHERGAFTGAERMKKGVFEMADGGTLFLDEIGEMPLHLQPKLLGVLDSGVFRRVGGQVECGVDVRIIAATNIDLREAIGNRRFREDLYYRLSVMRIHLPPLRERRQDIVPLVDHFMRSTNPERHYVLPAGELEVLQQYDWPGNVRELRNVIERAILLSSGVTIYPSSLLYYEGRTPAGRLIEGHAPGEHEPVLSLADAEKHHIHQVLQRFNQNRSQAANALGIARSTLLRKIGEYGLD